LEEGDVVEVKLIRDKQSGFPAGYGFVEFASPEIAEKVLETCNGNAIGRDQGGREGGKEGGVGFLWGALDFYQE
jgi:RNA recognition motif-containing protein